MPDNGNTPTVTPTPPAAPQAAPAASPPRATSPARNLDAVSPVFERTYREMFEYLKQDCQDLSENEFWHVVPKAEANRLDPVKGQILVHKRKAKANSAQTKLVILTTIDGYRTIAMRTGLYDGKSAVEWVGKDKEWREYLEDDDQPVAARVTVFRKGSSHGFPATVHFREFRKAGQEDGAGMWDKMPCNQLGKCVEVAALRSAFPDEYDGLYTVDEFPEYGAAHRTPTVARRERRSRRESRPPTTAAAPAAQRPTQQALNHMRNAIRLYLENGGSPDTLLGKITEIGHDTPIGADGGRDWNAPITQMVFDEAHGLYRWLGEALAKMNVISKAPEDTSASRHADTAPAEAADDSTGGTGDASAGAQDAPAPTAASDAPGTEPAAAAEEQATDEPQGTEDAPDAQPVAVAVGGQA